MIAPGSLKGTCMQHLISVNNLAFHAFAGYACTQITLFHPTRVWETVLLRVESPNKTNEEKYVDH